MKASFTRAEKPTKRAEKQTLAALFTEVPRRDCLKKHRWIAYGPIHVEQQIPHRPLRRRLVAAGDVPPGPQATRTPTPPQPSRDP